MRTETWTGTAYVNDGEGTPGELCVEREVITGWSKGPRRDLSWTFTDAAGHFHAADPGDVGYPTLRDESIAMPCDGSCGGVCEGEGYTTIRYSCRICGEEINPATVEGPYQFAVDGLTSWSVKVAGFFLGEEVSVRFERERDVWFGTAVGHDVTTESVGVGVDLAWSRLIGVSRLGHRDTS